MIFEPEKKYFWTYPPPTLIHLPHRITSASKPAAYKSFDCCLSHFRTCSAVICHFQTYFREFLDPVVNRFTRQTLPTVNRKHLFMNILCIESSCTQKTRKRTLIFGSTFLKRGPHFDYWNQLLNMRMRVCYLDSHEAGLCCYLVITHRKPITTITVVLLPFVTYLLSPSYIVIRFGNCSKQWYCHNMQFRHLQVPV
jgi:hypothetical protein